jgi:hypothetical protein
MVFHAVAALSGTVPERLGDGMMKRQTKEDIPFVAVFV